MNFSLLLRRTRTLVDLPTSIDQEKPKEEAEDRKTKGGILLVLAFFVLLVAFMMRGKSDLLALRFLVIVLGIVLTALGGFYSFVLK